jgi:uncharacterized protein YbjQ (UPF0145 family)
MTTETTETIAIRQIYDVIGFCQGSTVLSRKMGPDIFAGLKNIVIGQIEEYAKVHVQSREQAKERIIKGAEAIRAAAILNSRFTTSRIAQVASEVLVDTTALKLKQWIG